MNKINPLIDQDQDTMTVVSQIKVHTNKVSNLTEWLDVNDSAVTGYTAVGDRV